MPNKKMANQKMALEDPEVFAATLAGIISDANNVEFIDGYVNQPTAEQGERVAVINFKGKIPQLGRGTIAQKRKYYFKFTGDFKGDTKGRMTIPKVWNLDANKGWAKKAFGNKVAQNSAWWSTKVHIKQSDITAHVLYMNNI